jgi:hypothetical protein
MYEIKSFRHFLKSKWRRYKTIAERLKTYFKLQQNIISGTMYNIACYATAYNFTVLQIL